MTDDADDEEFDPLPYMRSRDRAPAPPDRLIRGVTLTATTVDGRSVVFRQPLVDPSRRAAGTWDGDRALICEVMAYLWLDPEEEPSSLHSVALALSHVAGDRGTVDNITVLLVSTHPRLELAREAHRREAGSLRSLRAR